LSIFSSHPSALDWLERLDDLSPRDRDHLARCPTCREIVVRLERNADVELPGACPEVDAVTAYEPTADEPAPDEIWQIRDGIDQVIVLAAGVDDLGDRWYPVMGLDPEVEAADDEDVLLLAEESSLGIRLRLRPDAQAAIRRGDLLARVGRLTSAGTRVLEGALGGEVDEARRGAPLVDEHDWRTDIDPDAWRRWWRLSTLRDSALAEAETAATMVRERLRDLMGTDRDSDGVDRWMSRFRPLAGTRDLWPSAGVWRDVAALLVPDAAGGPASVVEVEGAWPLRALDGAFSIEVDGPVLRLHGLPDRLEGTWPLAALLGPALGRTSASWEGGVPGLAAIDAPVAGGIATITLDAAPVDDAAAIAAGVVLLPPGLAGDDDGREHRTADPVLAPEVARVILSPGLEARLDPTDPQPRPLIVTGDDPDVDEAMLQALAHPSPPAITALSGLAIAQRRTSGHPTGPWPLDEVLAAVEFAAASGVPWQTLQGADGSPLIAGRLPRAIDVLEALDPVVEYGGADVRDVLLGRLAPLADVLDAFPDLRRRFDQWRQAVDARVSLTLTALPLPDRVDTRLGARSAPVWRDVVSARLAAADATLTVTQGRAGDVARLEIAAGARQAFADVRGAWWAARTGTGKALQVQRAALLFDAAVRGADQSDGPAAAARRLLAFERGERPDPGPEPTLPQIWLTAFDPASGMVAASQPLRVDETSVTRGHRLAVSTTLPPELAQLQLLVSLRRRDRVTPRGLLDEGLASSADPIEAARRTLQMGRASRSPSFVAGMRRAGDALARMAGADVATLGEMLLSAAIEARLGLEQRLRDELDSFSYSQLAWPDQAARIEEHAATADDLHALDRLIP
jgi:hypothetical protein